MSIARDRGEVTIRSREVAIALERAREPAVVAWDTPETVRGASKKSSTFI